MIPKKPFRFSDKPLINNPLIDLLFQSAPRSQSFPANFSEKHNLPIYT